MTEPIRDGDWMIGPYEGKLNEWAIWKEGRTPLARFYVENVDNLEWAVEKLLSVLYSSGYLKGKKDSEAKQSTAMTQMIKDQEEEKQHDSDQL